MTWGQPHTPSLVNEPMTPFKQLVDSVMKALYTERVTQVSPWGTPTQKKRRLTSLSYLGDMRCDISVSIPLMQERDVVAEMTRPDRTTYSIIDELGVIDPATFDKQV